MLITTERSDGVAVIKINRPEVRNALNLEALAALRETLERVGRDREVRCAVLAGEGGTFTTGDDLTETARLDDAGIRTLIDGFQALTVALRAMEQPVIAAIEGYAVGGALEMAAACDLRVCDAGDVQQVDDAHRARRLGADASRERNDDDRPGKRKTPTNGGHVRY